MMAKTFRTLREKMSPQAQHRAAEKADALIRDMPSEKCTKEESVEKESVEKSVWSGASYESAEESTEESTNGPRRCALHPLFKGLRRPRITCVGCHEFYNKQKASGVKETRTSKKA